MTVWCDRRAGSNLRTCEAGWLAVVWVCGAALRRFGPCQLCSSFQRSGSAHLTTRTQQMRSPGLRTKAPALHPTGPGSGWPADPADKVCKWLLRKCPTADAPLSSKCALRWDQTAQTTKGSRKGRHRDACAGQSPQPTPAVCCTHASSADAAAAALCSIGGIC